MPAPVIPSLPSVTYFVLTGSKFGTFFAERDVNDTDRKTTIADLMSGEIENPLRVIELSDGIYRDVSEDIAREIAALREHVPEGLIHFIELHAGIRLAMECEHINEQAEAA